MSVSDIFCLWVHYPIMLFRSLIAVLALACAAGAGATADTDAADLEITTGHYPPWAGTELPGEGVINRLVTAAFATQGLSVNYVHLPWKRALEETRRGNYPASSFWLPGEGQRQFLQLSDPLIDTRTVFFQRASDPPVSWEQMEDLAPYRIGATIGFTYTPAFYEAVDQGLIRVLFVPDERQNLKLLFGHRIDLFAASEFTGLLMANELGIERDRLRIVHPPLIQSPVYLLFSTRHPQGARLMSKFNKGFRLIRATGEYQRILDQAGFSNSALKTSD